jgi:hypothetical protein
MESGRTFKALSGTSPNGPIVGQAVEKPSSSQLQELIGHLNVHNRNLTEHVLTLEDVHFALTGDNITVESLPFPDAGESLLDNFTFQLNKYNNTLLRLQEVSTRLKNLVG